MLSCIRNSLVPSSPLPRACIPVHTTRRCIPCLHFRVFFLFFFRVDEDGTCFFLWKETGAFFSFLKSKDSKQTNKKRKHTHLHKTCRRKRKRRSIAWSKACFFFFFFFFPRPTSTHARHGERKKKKSSRVG